MRLDPVGRKAIQRERSANTIMGAKPAAVIQKSKTLPAKPQRNAKKDRVP